MGATCCSNQQMINGSDNLNTPNQRPQEMRTNDEDNYKDFTKQPTQRVVISNMKVGPELFVQLRKGDIYEHYTVGKKLGEGAYGCVSMVVHKVSGLKRAMKSIKKDSLFDEDEERLFAEMSILKDLDHPNTVKLYELYQDERFYYLITEYLAGGELFEKIQSVKQFTEKMAANIMRQIMSAVAYCHTKNIVHRDLKPENIIFVNNQEDSDLKVIDFGTSRKFGKEKLTKRLGTPYYIAPEVLNKDYNEKCDIWSCGVILYIMLAGYPPFNGRNEGEIFKRIMAGKFQFYNEEWKAVTNEAKELIKKMLTYSADDRPSAQEVLSDPWLQQNSDEIVIGVNVLQNLQKFSAQGKLRQSLLTFMASQMISEKEKEHIQKTFRQLDKNGDGTLSKEELMEAFKNIVTEKDKIIENFDERIMKIIDGVDVNKSGQIDYTEFIMASLQENKLLTEAKIKQTFQMLDLDGDHYISKEELTEVMGGFNDEVWNEFLFECDQDNDGRVIISEEEFIMILMSKV